MKNRILIITYHFPPSAAVGGLRLARFANHLPSFGWTPTVLTIPDGSIEHIDRGRLNEAAGAGIIKVKPWPTLRDVYLKIKKLAAGRSALPGNAGGRAASAPPEREPLKGKLKRWFNSLFMTLPDIENGWILPAAARAVREVRSRSICCILTSGPPHSVLLAGLLVKKLTGVRWAADFRDPWIIEGRKLSPVSALSNRIEAWLERSVIRSADLVVCNVERLSAAYRARFAEEDPDKFITIPNAVEPGAMPETAAPDKYARFTLSYTGSLYFGRSPEPVFQAVRLLLDQNKIREDAIAVQLAGQCRFIEDRPIEPVIRRYGLEKVVSVLDMVPRQQALDLVRRSHLALLFAPAQPCQIPAKAYDYLGLGARVLAIAEPGATADLVRETGCGKAFSSSDVNGISRYIEEAMHSEPGAGAERTLLSRFDGRALTGVLVRHLNRVCTAASCAVV